MPIIHGFDREGACVVKFSKSSIMDEAQIAQIAGEFESIVSRTGQSRLLVNFSGVNYMSSSMMGQLILLKKQCDSAGVKLKFCQIAPSVMEVFNIMSLNRVFSIYTDEPKALKAFNKKGWFR